MKFKSFEEWIGSVPETLTNDPLWQMEVHRLSVFVADIGWFDVSTVSKDRRMLKLADQLYRALGSIGANIAEGYSRRSGKDRARFYEYALGSAREGRHWYYSARHVLRSEVTMHRLALLTQIIRLLLTMIPRQRSRDISEPSVSYRAHAMNDGSAAHREELAVLLKEVPSV